jgi:hypothetical protein
MSFVRGPVYFLDVESATSVTSTCSKGRLMKGGTEEEKLRIRKRESSYLLTYLRAEIHHHESEKRAINAATQMA